MIIFFTHTLPTQITLHIHNMSHLCVTVHMCTGQVTHVTITLESTLYIAAAASIYNFLLSTHTIPICDIAHITYIYVCPATYVTVTQPRTICMNSTACLLGCKR